MSTEYQPTVVVVDKYTFSNGLPSIVDRIRGKVPPIHYTASFSGLDGSTHENQIVALDQNDLIEAIHDKVNGDAILVLNSTDMNPDMEQKCADINPSRKRDEEIRIKFLPIRGREEKVFKKINQDVNDRRAKEEASVLSKNEAVYSSDNELTSGSIDI